MADDLGLFRGVPTELIFKIFGYLPADFLWRNVRLVCRHFQIILNEQKKFWHLRMQRKYPAVVYPYTLGKGVGVV